MFRNYLKIAVRTLLKHRLYTGINIVGLALGMACALLIGLWLRDELRYNQFLPNAADTYLVRVNYNFKGGETMTSKYTPGPLQGALERDFPDVAISTKISLGQELLLKPVGSNTGSKAEGHYVTGSFFDVFQLPVWQGNPKVALADPNKIIISRRLAGRYFGNQPALGRLIQLDNGTVYTVGAILENLPHASTLQFDWLAPFSNPNEPWMMEWGMNSFLTYIRLKPSSLADVNRIAKAEASMKDTYRRYAKFNNNEQLILQPITDLHLYGDYKNGSVVGGRIEYVRIFGIVALFILLIACINFVNLATARSAVRAKEVGVRKVVGALRSSLIGQFITESMLTSLLAVFVALGMAFALLPTFNAQFTQQLTLDLTDGSLWLLVAGLVFVTGFLSGSYPALFLSGLQPIRILKGVLRLNTGGIMFRRGLVVFQFSVSIFLIVGMMVVGRQMNYLRTKNLGLDRENVIYVPLEGELAPKMDAFRQAVLRLPTVASASLTSHLPVNIQSNTTDLRWPGQAEKQLVSVYAMNVGSDFIRTMNIDLLSGRDFGPNSRADSSNYLINEAAANLMFSYHFLDEAYEQLYTSEQQISSLINLFGMLAIVISCLGLFALAAFTAEQRTKEIGVRKVLGASVSSIVALLSKDFLKLVLIAIVIASPIAWYATNRWLQDFAYKIDIEWWVFALSGLLAVGIALLTVSFQSVKAALMNPVRSLRSE